MNYCLIVVSMMTLAFISIDRFVHIVYPLQYREIITIARIRITIVWTWIQGAIIGKYLVVLCIVLGRITSGIIGYRSDIRMKIFCSNHL